MIEGNLIRVIQLPLGLIKEQMETSITSAASKQGFYSIGCSFLSYSPARHIGFPAFKSYICKHPSHKFYLVHKGNVEADKNGL